MGDTVLGPIDYLAVEWPQRHVTGEGFRLLMDLVEREIVRVLDLQFIAKDADGKVATVDARTSSTPTRWMSVCGACRPACSTSRTSTRSPRRSNPGASRESSFTRMCGRSRCGRRSIAAAPGLWALGVWLPTI
jgi:hypothetical protein